MKATGSTLLGLCIFLVSVRPSHYQDSSEDFRGPARTGVTAQAPAMAQSITDTRYYSIELLVVVDYSIYHQNYHSSSKTDPREKAADAQQRIKYYFAHVVNLMDFYFSSVKQISSHVRIHVQICGYFIATEPAQSPWTEIKNRISSSPLHYLDAYPALDAFEIWLANESAKLPTFDHAILFTRYKLWNGLWHKSKRVQISGVANLNGMCLGGKRSALVQDRGIMSTSLTAAHEMGHNLGASHDGRGNKCSSRDQFIMASAPGGVSNKTRQNIYRFSPCSVRYFEEFMQTLIRTEKNCLQTTAAVYNLSEVSAFLRKMPGQMFDPHQQCKQRFGQDSYYCGGSSEDRLICRRMRCYDPEANGCIGASDMMGMDGTTCGNKKWCYHGYCINDVRAPEASDKCLYGDFRGLVEGKISCIGLVNTQPFKCYTAYYRDLCCGSCKKIYDAAHKGCEYGNKAEWCKRAIHPRECYGIAGTCCKTCRQYYQNVTGCEYGDRATWCSSIYSRDCYGTSKTCCRSCKLYKKGPKGCEYGNKASWCSTLSVQSCKLHRNKEICCQVCMDRASTTVTTRVTTRSMPPLVDTTVTSPMSVSAIETTQDTTADDTTIQSISLTVQSRPDHTSTPQPQVPDNTGTDSTSMSNATLSLKPNTTTGTKSKNKTNGDKWLKLLPEKGLVTEINPFERSNNTNTTSEKKKNCSFLLQVDYLVTILLILSTQCAQWAL